MFGSLLIYSILTVILLQVEYEFWEDAFIDANFQEMHLDEAGVWYNPYQEEDDRNVTEYLNSKCGYNQG